MSSIPYDPATGEVTEPPERRPFAAWLVEQRRGALAADLSDRLSQIALAVAETGKKGSLTLTLSITANGQGAVKVSDKITTKVPEADQPEAFFYVDQNGNLTRNDPRQPVLPMAVDEVTRRREGAGA